MGAALPQKQRTASLSRVRDEERNVENFMLCSFLHFACSPVLQAFLHEDEMCKVACHFSLDVLFPLSELSGCSFFAVDSSTVAAFLNRAPIMEGLQQ